MVVQNNTDVPLRCNLSHRGISAPGNGKEVVDVLNAVDKRYIYIN